MTTMHQALWFGGGGGAPPAANILLTYDTPATREGVEILEYYNGGQDGAGNVGPAYGVSHPVGDGLVYNGLDNVENHPSPGGSLILAAGDNMLVINFPAGVTGGVTVSYTSSVGGLLEVCSNINAVGVIGSTNFGSTGSPCLNTDASFSLWSNVYLPFAGTAKSLRITGVAFQTIVDSIILGDTHYVYPRIVSSSGIIGKLYIFRNGQMEVDIGYADKHSLHHSWCTPCGPGKTPGDNYWVRATVLAGILVEGVAGVWQPLSVDRTYDMNIGGKLKIEIASDAAGATIVATTDNYMDAWIGDGDVLGHFYWG